MDLKPIFDKMHGGEIYYPSDTNLMIKQFRCVDKLRFFNALPRSPLGYIIRGRMMKKMFAEVGKNCYIEPPFYANWGGKHVHFGNNVYANFNLTCVDDTHIYVGDNTMIAPNVTIVTATHPIAPALRQKGYQYNKPVTIGKNCWIGAGVIILPGVHIGDNSVIGAGALVNKDIPENVVAVGVPAKVLRPIEEQDNLVYDKTRPIDPKLFL